MILYCFPVNYYKDIFKEQVESNIRHYINDIIRNRFHDNSKYKKVSVKMVHDEDRLDYVFCAFVYLNNGCGHCYPPLKITTETYNSFQKMTPQEFKEKVEEIYNNYEKGVRII